MLSSLHAFAHFVAFGSNQVIAVAYDPDEDEKRSNGDMELMAGDMMTAIGPKYSAVGLVDSDGTDGFSMLLGHLVPNQMLAEEPTKAPNFVWLVNMLADCYLHGRPPSDVVKRALDAHAGETPAGRIDFLSCAGISTKGVEGLRKDVGSFSMGGAAGPVYFDGARFQAWVDAVQKAGGRTPKSLGW